MKRISFTAVFRLIFPAVVCVCAVVRAEGPRAEKAVLDRLAQAGGAEKYADANTVVVAEEREVTFQEDGTYLDRSYNLIKVLTDTGKKGLGELWFEYTRQYDAIRLERARVIKPDGSVIDVPEEMIKDITHPALAQMNIYDANVRMKTVTFKGLEVGDAVEYAVVDSCYLAPMEDQFDLLELFQGSDPIVHKSVKIDGPVSRPLRYLVKDGEASFVKSQQDGRIIYAWEVNDVVRIVSEPAMPSPLSFAPRLLVSTIGSWDQISRWWYGMTQKFRDQDDSLRAVTIRLTESLPDREAKVKAIYHFVAQKIRYMGLGTGKKAGFEPKPATETLATRYGVCRDVAVLMCSMLDVAGIESEAVLTRAGELIDPEIPTIMFNHAIVALPDGKEGFVFCDPTVENCPELLMPAEGDASMMVCTARGENLLNSPHSPAKDNLGKLSARTRFSGDGKLCSEVTISTDGIYDYAFRGWVKRFPPQQLSNIWQSIVTEIHPGARLTGFSTTDTEDLYSPFQLNFSYEVQDYAVEAGNYLLIKSPISTDTFELMLRSFLSGAGLPKRNYPYELGITLGSVQEETLEMPSGYRVKSLPEAVELDSGPLRYRMSYAGAAPESPGSAQTVSFHKEFLIDSKMLDPGQYLELKKILRLSSRSDRGEIILEK